MKLEPMPVSQLAVVKSGGGAPQEASAFGPTGYPFVRAGSLPKLLNGEDEDSLEKLEPNAAERYGLKLFEAGTVLFAKSGMSATKGHVYRLRGKAYVVNHLAALVPHNQDDSRFLERALQKFSPSTLIRDPAYPSIRLGDIERMKVLAPRDPEHRQRIAEILDKADALCAKRRAALAQFDTLIQSIFLDMFGDPVTNPKGWPRVPFSDLLDRIESGWSPKCLDRPARGGEWGVLKLGAITWCEYDPSENKTLPADVEPRPKLEVQQGDLLFSRKNTYELVAACALVRETPKRLLLPDLIFRFQLRSSTDVTRSFLQQLLTFPTKRAQVQRLAGGSAGSMPNISKGRLEKLPIEVPPILEQQKFEERANAVTRAKAVCRKSLITLNAAFVSIQQRAFRGDL